MLKPFITIMSRTKEVKLGDAIHAFLREEGLETPLNEYRAEQAWSTVMGEVIASYTQKVSVRGGILYVQVSNAALRQELMMQRPQIVARINQYVGAQVLQQVVVR